MDNFSANEAISNVPGGLLNVLQAGLQTLQEAQAAQQTPTSLQTPEQRGARNEQRRTQQVRDYKQDKQQQHKAEQQESRRRVQAPQMARQKKEALSPGRMNRRQMADNASNPEIQQQQQMIEEFLASQALAELLFLGAGIGGLGAAGPGFLERRMAGEAGENLLSGARSTAPAPNGGWPGIPGRGAIEKQPLRTMNVQPPPTSAVPNVPVRPSTPAPGRPIVRGPDPDVMHKYPSPHRRHGPPNRTSHPGSTTQSGGPRPMSEMSTGRPGWDRPVDPYWSESSTRWKSPDELNSSFDTFHPRGRRGDPAYQGSRSQARWEGKKAGEKVAEKYKDTSKPNKPKKSSRQQLNEHSKNARNKRKKKQDRLKGKNAPPANRRIRREKKQNKARQFFRK